MEKNSPSGQPQSAQALLLSVASAAELLGISPKTLRNWLSAGRSPVQPVKVGARTMFRFSDICAYVDGLAPVGRAPALPIVVAKRGHRRSRSSNSGLGAANA